MFNQVLQRIRDNDTSYVEITELNNTTLDEFQAEQLALALQKNTNLRKIEFRNMQLDAKKLEWLIWPLPINSNLTYIDLSENNLGDNAQVAQVLKHFLT